MRAVDTIQVRTCPQMGWHIVAFEQGGLERAAYGQRLLQGNEQVFVSKYKLVLPVEEELRAALDRERSVIDDGCASCYLLRRK
ncbi:hypothetical protein QN362_04800 [Actimicrobium sp. CCC2.4]|uniref:hypothetical protein n=1 Tax=Actimicrobium sp. CCC2.4 TaxID=3048606 RepID=UPI002AC8B666|nr:hypothetical protein [Actimicrobium sp. CCC2.4]MEB0134644.1 hypothetical protein [Actimicrobium sp. CCC2.4]WPX30588.1 hypothetical protein RHM62_09885 [Actimicrobium sp. CCC2.4]